MPKTIYFITKPFAERYIKTIQLSGQTHTSIKVIYIIINPTIPAAKIILIGFIPIIITVTFALIATVIAEACRFFPPLHYGYDWLILISAYIVWCTAIYTLSSKIASKIHNIRKHKDDEEKVEE